jgi:hypothetical protein
MAEKKKDYFRLFKDILKEGRKYSQGRVYLLWSVFAYYITLGILMIAGIRKDDIDMENFRMIVEALEYAMTLFGGYVFGGKFISAYQAIKGVAPKEKSEEPPADADMV